MPETRTLPTSVEVIQGILIIRATIRIQRLQEAAVIQSPTQSPAQDSLQPEVTPPLLRHSLHQVFSPLQTLLDTRAKTLQDSVALLIHHTVLDTRTLILIPRLLTVSTILTRLRTANHQVLTPQLHILITIIRHLTSIPITTISLIQLYHRHLHHIQATNIQNHRVLMTLMKLRALANQTLVRKNLRARRTVPRTMTPRTTKNLKMNSSLMVATSCHPAPRILMANPRHTSHPVLITN